MRFVSDMSFQPVIDVAQALVSPGKGVLAADESVPTIARRFAALGIENTEVNRRAYREMLFRTEGISRWLSGVILHDETIRQNGADGTPLSVALQDQGTIPGIKVDKGTYALPNAPGEVVTEGLDNLRERLAEYRELGARFAKWRAVIQIGTHVPSKYCIEVNAHALARYAALTQEANMAPIVEPEVLMDGDHSIERCSEVTEFTLREVFDQLARQRVRLEGLLLKPNMVVSGKDAPNRASPEEVAERTLTCLKRAVPAAVPGIVFLSGGQEGIEAALNLNAINKLAARVNAPWQLSFSFARALQATPLKIWSGQDSNIPRARRAFYHLASMASAARQGAYNPEMETQLAAIGQ